MKKVVVERRESSEILKQNPEIIKYSIFSVDANPRNEPRNEPARKKKGKSLKEYLNVGLIRICRPEKSS